MHNRELLAKENRAVGPPASRLLQPSPWKVFERSGQVAAKHRRIPGVEIRQLARPTSRLPVEIRPRGDIAKQPFGKCVRHLHDQATDKPLAARLLLLTLRDPCGGLDMTYLCTSGETCMNHRTDMCVQSNPESRQTRGCLCHTSPNRPTQNREPARHPSRPEGGQSGGLGKADQRDSMAE